MQDCLRSKKYEAAKANKGGVKSFAGGCHAHNVGASLLDAMGMREGWVAHSEDEYVRLAVAAAADVPKLAALRMNLRQQMLASRLCDAPTFVRQLEDTYRQLWLRRVAVSRVAAGSGSGGAVGSRVDRHNSAPVADVSAAAWEAAQNGRAATS